jgi:GNAT superfamily N-acetyltransferase
MEEPRHVSPCRLLGEKSGMNGMRGLSFVSDDAGADPRPAGAFLAMHDGLAVGRLAVREDVIESLSVLESWRGRGVGRFLVTEYVRLFPARALRAEADEETMGFFHSLGFRVGAPVEAPDSGARYDCLFDDHAFDPLPYADAVGLCRAAGVPCWVSGGWALDLFHGRQTRPHEDTDILILRGDQEKLFDAFPGWEIYRTHAPGLAHWNGVPFLDEAPNVWLRRNEAEPWALEVMLLDGEGEEWAYRRNRAIRGRLSEIGLLNADGIPYLRPEIQLLYKGGSSVRRDKDTDDMLRILPLLSAESRAWLADALRTQFPGGHDWLGTLEACSAAPRG